jgi:hypothetical protein
MPERRSSPERLFAITLLHPLSEEFYLHAVSWRCKNCARCRYQGQRFEKKG